MWEKRELTDAYIFKILTAGEGEVGKTSFLRRFVDNYFPESYKLTIGVDFLKKTIKRGDSYYCLILWDFGGQERFRDFLINFSAGGDGAFFLYDLTKRTSLDNITDWIEILRKKNPKMPIFMIGTKYDLMEKNDLRDMKDISFKYKKQLKLDEVIVTSAKTGYNVENSFNSLIDAIIKTKKIFFKLRVKSFDNEYKYFP